MTLFTAMEAEARELTWRAYRRRQRNRLFPIPDIDGGDRSLWPKLDEMYWGKAVGVVAPLGEMYTFHEHTTVGVWHGIGPGFLGADLTLTHFSGLGSSTHRSPLNIAFVHVLPPVFQKVPNGWRARDREEDSASYKCYCGYVYKEDEYACQCHYTCAACCLGQERLAA